MGPSMKEKLSRYFFYFMLYSIIGWIYEVFLEVVIYHWGYSNRGVLFGPCCVIYGVGALILLFSLHGLKRRSIRLGPVPITPVLVFVAIVVITTIGWFSIDAYLIGQTTNTLFPVIPTASRAPGAPRSSTSWLPSPRTTRFPSAGSAASTRPIWTWCSVSWAARP